MRVPIYVASTDMKRSIHDHCDERLHDRDLIVTMAGKSALRISVHRPDGVLLPVAPMMLRERFTDYAHLVMYLNARLELRMFTESFYITRDAAYQNDVIAEWSKLSGRDAANQEVFAAAMQKMRTVARDVLNMTDDIRVS